MLRRGPLAAVTQIRGPFRREHISLVVLVGLLLAYANGSALSWAKSGGLPSGVNKSHLAMLMLLLGWAGVERLPASELGLGRVGAPRSLLWGAVVGIIAAIPVRLFFAFPLLTNDALRQPQFQGMSRARLTWLLGGHFLLGTAVLEEVAFRGLLQAKLERLVSPRLALIVSSAVFAAWHLVITWANLRRTNLPRPLFPFLYCGAMAVLFSAGIMFGLVRKSTGHLAGSIIAHWLIVVNIVLAVARPEQVRKIAEEMAEAVTE